MIYKIHLLLYKRQISSFQCKNIKDNATCYLIIGKFPRFTANNKYNKDEVGFRLLALHSLTDNLIEPQSCCSKPHQNIRNPLIRLFRKHVLTFLNTNNSSFEDVRNLKKIFATKFLQSKAVMEKDLEAAEW